MRGEDLEKLQLPFREGEDLDQGFARAVKVHIPAIASLHKEILDDLDDRVFGVGWWKSHLDTNRRILIADHLISCVHSVQINLIEASLHLLEAVDYWDQESNFLADTISSEADHRPQFKLNPRKSPSQDLPRRLASLHAVGFIRAIGSTLDCLGACILGVLALPKNILLADFKIVQKSLRGISAAQTDAGVLLQRSFGQKLEETIQESGPIDWMSWALGFRNMLVHRGRRSHLSQLLPPMQKLYGPNGKPILRVRTVEQLPSEPDKSQVEAYVMVDEKPPALTEHAEITLSGLQQSTVNLITTTARELVNIWRVRRATPDLLIQPRSQWPEGLSKAKISFPGYRPESTPFDPTHIRMHEDDARRLKAASLDDENRPRWTLSDT